MGANMRQELMEIISTSAELPIEAITNRSKLVEDLKMDSLMLLDLLIRLEKIIKRKIKPEEMVAVKTVTDVMEFIEEHK